MEDAEGFVDRKVAALMEHRSQFRSTMHIDNPEDTAEVTAFADRVSERLREHGALAGLPLGEAFKLIHEL